MTSIDASIISNLLPPPTLCFPVLVLLLFLANLPRHLLNVTCALTNTFDPLIHQFNWSERWFDSVFFFAAQNVFTGFSLPLCTCCVGYLFTCPNLEHPRSVFEGTKHLFKPISLKVCSFSSFNPTKTCLASCFCTQNLTTDAIVEDTLVFPTNIATFSRENTPWRGNCSPAKSQVTFLPCHHTCNWFALISLDFHT